MKEKIKSLVEDALKETQESTGKSFDLGPETVLLGEGAVLDSFDFVSSQFQKSLQGINPLENRRKTVSTTTESRII